MRSSGSDPAVVHIIGEADTYRTVTGYGVTPAVGIVPPDLPLLPNPAEVADWFEAPLDFVLDPANQRANDRRFPRGRTAALLSDRLAGPPNLGRDRGDAGQSVAADRMKLEPSAMARPPRIKRLLKALEAQAGQHPLRRRCGSATC